MQKNIVIDFSIARAVINYYERAAALDGVLWLYEAAVFELKHGSFYSNLSN